MYVVQVQSVDIKVDNNNRDNRDTFKHKGTISLSHTLTRLLNECQYIFCTRIWICYVIYPTIDQ